jgi:hypothetical protein
VDYILVVATLHAASRFAVYQVMFNMICFALGQTYIFKLMNSSGITESGESEKVLLLMESGVRLHTTQYVRLDAAHGC